MEQTLRSTVKTRSTVTESIIFSSFSFFFDDTIHKDTCTHTDTNTHTLQCLSQSQLLHFLPVGPLNLCQPGLVEMTLSDRTDCNALQLLCHADKRIHTNPLFSIGLMHTLTPYPNLNHHNWKYNPYPKPNHKLILPHFMPLLIK